MLLLAILFLLLFGCILTHSGLALAYAATGLDLWFRNMIPALLPFMILSGIMVRMKLTDRASCLLYTVIKPFYKVRKNVCYAMLVGFLCGFPMGARVTADLYARQMVSRREAEYLLAFCNNIGPVYFCSFVLPLLCRELTLPYLFGMYGIPLLYGLALRHTAYRDLSLPQETGKRAASDLVCCESLGARLLAETEMSIQASMQAILSLGGYMILYNLLNLLPHILSGRPPKLLSPLLEITGGLKLLGAAHPLYSLLSLSFGGLSCIAQTYSCIADSDLSIANYILHKLLLTALNGLFYLCWLWLSPASFLL